MGFFVVTLFRRLRIHPRLFGVKLRENLTQRLIMEVEGTFVGNYGFLVAVLKLLEPIPDATLDDETGFAVFPLHFQAVVFRPFRGQVIDTVVTKLTQHGFFAECGPLTVFVSHHLLPHGMQFVQGNEWATRDGSERIALSSSVRIRILGLKIEANEISATGSIKDPYLGPLEE